MLHGLAPSCEGTRWLQLRDDAVGGGRGGPPRRQEEPAGSKEQHKNQTSQDVRKPTRLFALDLTHNLPSAPTPHLLPLDSTLSVTLLHRPPLISPPPRVYLIPPACLSSDPPPTPSVFTSALCTTSRQQQAAGKRVQSVQVFSTIALSAPRPQHISPFDSKARWLFNQIQPECESVETHESGR